MRFNKMVANAGYWVGHRWIVTAICIFGIVNNVLNIIIWRKLCRRDPNKAMHILFLWLSVIDFLVILCYGTFDVYFFWITGPVKEIKHSECGMYLVLVCYTLYVVFYTASKWMTVALSIFRAIIIFSPERRNIWCSGRRAHIAAAGVLVGAVVLWGTPIYMYYTVQQISNSTNESSATYWLAKKEIVQTNHWYKQFVLYVYGIFFESIPMILLLVFSFKFIVKLCEGQSHDGEQNHLIANNDGTRFTALLAILALFYVIAGLTMGIYAVYSAIKKSSASDIYYFMDDAYINNFTDPTELLNCSLGFVFYILMYPKFKREGRLLFCCNFVKEINVASVSTDELAPTGAQVNVNKYDRLREEMF